MTLYVTIGPVGIRSLAEVLVTFERIKVRSIEFIENYFIILIRHFIVKTLKFLKQIKMTILCQWNVLIYPSCSPCCAIRFDVVIWSLAKVD